MPFKSSKYVSNALDDVASTIHQSLGLGDIIQRGIEAGGVSSAAGWGSAPDPELTSLGLSGLC
jgi:hypothetical protein